MGQEVAADAMVGRVLTGAYRIERRIGHGGMGVVYEATHTRVERRFAIKVLRQVGVSEASIERFKREAMLGSRLGNDYIVAVVDFNRTDEGNPFIVMELLQGEDLSVVLQREGKLPLERAASIVRQVCLALATAHGEGVIHRDLKPENIFLCRTPGGGEKVKVLDFGVSKIPDTSQNLTSEDQIVGTPWYMAPEQVKSKSSEIDHRADIYALGLVLYHMLAGERPIEADNLPAVLLKVMEGKVEPLWTHRPDLPQEVLQVVNRATARSPEGRYASALEMAADMERALGAQWNDVLRRELGESGRAPAVVRASTRPLKRKATPEALAETENAPSGDVVSPPVTGPRAPARQPPVRSTTGTESVELSRPRSRMPLLAVLGVAVVVGAVAALLFLRSRDSTPDAVAAPPVPDARRAPVAATPPAHDTGPPAPVLHTVTVTADDAKAVCWGRVDGGVVQTRAVPCRFEVPAGSSFELQVRRRGYGKFSQTWTVHGQRAIAVEVRAKSKRIVLAGDDEQPAKKTRRPHPKRHVGKQHQPRPPDARAATKDKPPEGFMGWEPK